jgi:putative DNA primase/helicase
MVGAKPWPAGLYYHDVGEKNGDSFPIEIWICPPLEVSAKTANPEDAEYGRLLEFTSSNGRAKKWSMPMALLAGKADELLQRLYDEGLEISYANRRKIAEYICSEQPLRFLHCATRTGWHSHTTFVLPDEVIGVGDIWFQSTTKIAAYAKAGTSDHWQNLVAGRALGNPNFIFALSYGFSGPLLERLNFPGVGIHYYGDTTKGKTTVLEADASIWGQGRRYLRAWRATANGLEGTCVQHTDTLLVLDEIAEINSRELNEVAYFLVNGQGKTRSDRYGEAKAAKSWRVPLLSSGEESLRIKLAAAGISIKEGQSLRILDIPCVGNYGLFDDLHGFENGALFSLAIREAASQHYGHAGPAFVKALIKQNRGDLAQRHAEILLRFSTQNHQEARAARCFALAALAGELATEAGIVPWESDDATSAALKVFCFWCDARETSLFGAEHFQILSRVSEFIDAHSDSRFSDRNWTPSYHPIHGYVTNSEPTIRDRAGYWDDSGTSRVYLFTAGGLKEATKGFEFKRVLKALKDAGAFAHPGADATACVTRIPGNCTRRLYWINPDKLHQDTVSTHSNQA